ncbi:hypothetical protein ACI2LJ_27585 [Streptomyces sp. NPDC088090]|uniref:hypothetical protein n=1 Tax=Streptomyces sp. NPDC088090 TaxID=3365822 RepID=UPI00384ED6A5
MSAVDRLFHFATTQDMASEEMAARLLADLTAQHQRTGRTDALLEAIVVARQLTLPLTGPEGQAYNKAITDAVAAIEKLVKDGAA